MILDFKDLRVTAKYPVYPPYHKGLYLEEFFYDYYLKNKEKFKQTNSTLIPIFWTAIYNQNENRHLIQSYLNALPAGNYFCVSQQDDAVAESLPQNTISFEAGGNGKGIPIPLICSSLENVPVQEKQHFCSFVGTLTHKIRKDIYESFKNDKMFELNVSEWSIAVSEEQFNNFITTTAKSEFTLCPRGYGPSSFRLYETLQLNSIPVYIYDREWLPFKQYIDWSEFCVLIERKDIKNIKTILKSISSDKKETMLRKGKEIYKNYFTLEKTSEQILKILESYKM